MRVAVGACTKSPRFTRRWDSVDGVVRRRGPNETEADLHVFRSHLALDRIERLQGNLFGPLDSRPRLGAQAKGKLACVNHRENLSAEGSANDENNQAAYHKVGHDDDAATGDDEGRDLLVTATQLLEKGWLRPIVCRPRAQNPHR